jgi:DNA polymerase-3 subunit delta'
MVCYLGTCSFKAKGMPAIQDLTPWSENSKLRTRNTKEILQFCMEMFRQALLLNYETPSLVYFEPKVDKFKLENFAPFVNVITYTIYLKNSLMPCIM